MAIPTPPLSANDARILHALFDPETLPSSVAKSKDAAAINPSLPAHPSIKDSRLESLERRQGELVKRINVAEQAKSIVEIQAVLKVLDSVLKEEPEYGSAYVNRAMAHRILLEHQHIAKPESEKGSKSIFDLPEELLAPLFSDLAAAITSSLPAPPSSSLSSPSPSSSGPQAPVSEHQARILRTAYSHRAYLYLKAAERGEWQGKSKSELEELASRDFGLAARYGDEKAREMSVRTNPYSKLCGAIVREALGEEIRAGKRG